MKLTPKAESILSPLEDALFAVQNVITPETEKSGKRKSVFKIATNDHIMATIGGPLSQIIQRDDVDILPQFLSAGGHSAAQLISGEIEYVIAPKFVMLSSGASVRDLKLLNSQTLFSEPMVGIGHRDDRAMLSELSQEEYLKYPHASFEIAADQNISMEQAYLVGNSLVQNDIVRFSSYSALLSAITQTRCIALVPTSFASIFKALFDFDIFQPPVAFPPVEWIMIWHRRNDDIDRHVQFRTIIKNCALDVANSLSQSDFSGT